MTHFWLAGSSGHALLLANRERRECINDSSMVRRLTVTILANRSTMYRGSPTSRLQSFGSLMIPDAASVLTR